MDFLVTGGAGFIGSHFVDFLLLSDKLRNTINKVIVLDKLTYAGSTENLIKIEKDNRFEFIRGDIKDKKLIETIMKDKMIIVNFAAESHVDNSINNPEDFFLTNALGTSVLLEVAKSLNEIRFVQVSTDEVYGSISSGRWDENFPLEPNSPYAASKASADLICRAYFKTFGINILITRCSNNFGPRQHREKLIPTILNNLFEGKKIPVYGDGENIRDWLFVGDHVSGIWQTILHGVPGEIYNLGGGTELSNLDLISLICTKLGFGQNSFQFVADRKGHDRRYALDYSKAKAELGYAPSASFSTQIDQTIKYYSDLHHN